MKGKQSTSVSIIGSDSEDSDITIPDGKRGAESSNDKGYNSDHTNISRELHNSSVELDFSASEEQDEDGQGEEKGEDAAEVHSEDQQEGTSGNV